MLVVYAYHVVINANLHRQEPAVQVPARRSRQSLTIAAMNYSGRASKRGRIFNLIDRPRSSLSSSFITPTGSKTVTYSKNIHGKKHKTHKISYKSENKSSNITLWASIFLELSLQIPHFDVWYAVAKFSRLKSRVGL